MVGTAHNAPLPTLRSLILCTDRIRQLLPWLHRPVARCGPGWRGQHEDNWKILQRRLPAQRDRFRRSTIEKARSLLAGEGDGHRPIVTHLFPEGRNIDGEGEGLMVHSRAELAKIGKANAEFQQRPKFMRLVSARGYADLVERAPKTITAMRVVMAYVSRPLSSSGADEDQSQLIPKLVRKHFQRVRTFFVKSGEAEKEWLLLITAFR
jgi:hypothetical protein